VYVMTCREFKHDAASLTLRELTHTQDPQIVAHASTCAGCDSWLQEQRTLSASMHALRSRTVDLEAGPNVEQALLRVFRRSAPASVATLPASAEAIRSGRELTPIASTGLREFPGTAPTSAPWALRLSRFFEMGAYAAVAAAIVVALLLGVHLLRLGSGTAPVHSQPASARTAPQVRQPNVVATNSGANTTIISKAEQRRADVRRVSPLPTHPAPKNVTAIAQADADDSQADTDDGYMALMFCDPLSCSSDSQVVRMELPAENSGGQPKAADVVVGYDGVVRAVRLVN
jgi:hypothetical protein